MAFKHECCNRCFCRGTHCLQKLPNHSVGGICQMCNLPSFITGHLQHMACNCWHTFLLWAIGANCERFAPYGCACSMHPVSIQIWRCYIRKLASHTYLEPGIYMYLATCCQQLLNGLWNVYKYSCEMWAASCPYVVLKHDRNYLHSCSVVTLRASMWLSMVEKEGKGCVCPHGFGVNVFINNHNLCCLKINYLVS